MLPPGKSTVERCFLLANTERGSIYFYGDKQTYFGVILGILLLWKLLQANSEAFCVEKPEVCRSEPCLVNDIYLNE